MALGIDIYRYQTVTDWNAVKRHGVAFVYVKGTDGGGPAIVRATAQVRGAQSVGLPVGLYHYAQLSPSPEVQADILTAEVRRLDATGLPPALDLEDPFRPDQAARDFARRFLTRLRANGFPYVTLYGNTSMLNGISADTLGVPGTVIWLAAYGPNDGRRHPHAYRGRVNIHQYTSVGGVPGISGQVDLNESLTPLPLGGDDVDLNDSMRAFIWPHDDTIQETVGSTIANAWSYSKTLATELVPALLTALNGMSVRMATMEGVLAGQGEVLRQIAANEEVDMAAVRQAAREGAALGVAESTIDVDITLAGRTADQPPTAISGAQEGQA